MTSATPSETITIVIGDDPRRWNGAYTKRLSSTDSTEQATTATSIPIQTETPSWLIQYAMNAPAVMTAANARLSTSVTANCRVNPTAAMASTAEVIRPKPTEARNRLPARSLPGVLPGAAVPQAPGRTGLQEHRSRGDRAQLGGADVARHVDGAG